MFRYAAKNRIKAIVFTVAANVACLPLSAELNTLKSLEAVTGLMRGVCSSIEYGLGKDDSKSADLKRFLLSAVRVGHDVLAIVNHKTDYQSSHLFGLAYVDSVQMISRGIDLTGILGSNRDIQSQEQANDVLNSHQTGSADSDALIFMQEEKEFLRRYALPALESIAAVYLAGASEFGFENQKMLFTAQALLALIRTCHIGLDQENDTAKTAAGVIALALLTHALYELGVQNSGLSVRAGHDEMVDQQRRALEQQDLQQARLLQQEIRAWRAIHPLSQQEIERRQQRQARLWGPREINGSIQLDLIDDIREFRNFHQQELRQAEDGQYLADLAEYRAAHPLNQQEIERRQQRAAANPELPEAFGMGINGLDFIDDVLEYRNFQQQGPQEIAVVVQPVAMPQHNQQERDLEQEEEYLDRLEAGIELLEQIVERLEEDANPVVLEQPGDDILVAERERARQDQQAEEQRRLEQELADRLAQQAAQEADRVAREQEALEQRRVQARQRAEAIERQIQVDAERRRQEEEAHLAAEQAAQAARQEQLAREEAQRAELREGERQHRRAAQQAEEQRRIQEQPAADERQRREEVAQRLAEQPVLNVERPAGEQVEPRIVAFRPRREVAPEQKDARLRFRNNRQGEQRREKNND